MVIVNKRGVTKTAMPGRQGIPNPLTWTSKYGSVTFNQYGRELPMGGMNEVGLVVEIMMLNETQYPSPDSRPAVGSLQWIQYQLDSFRTVEEVIASDLQMRIRQSGGPGVHFLVCDRSGDCASIEFLGGKLVYHAKEKMPVKTLTNSTYAKSIGFWKEDKLPAYDVSRSVERFIRAANMVNSYDPKTSKTSIDYAFGILKDVSQGSSTKWSIVYDISGLRVYFRTFENQKIRYFDLRSFDFSCATPVKILDVNADLSGEITEHFVDYTYQVNRDLIENAFGKTYFLISVPEEALDGLARYPGGTACEH